MKEFSASSAAFAIFDFAKHNRVFVLKYIVLYAIFVLAACAAFGFVGYFDLFKIITNTKAEEAATAQAINDWSARTTPFIMLFTVVCVALWVMYAAAVWRKMLRGEEIGFHGLTWGKDENRLAFAFLIYYALNIGFNFVFILVFMVGAAIVAGISQFAWTLGVLVGVIMSVVAIAAIFVFFVRVSQFGVLTIATRKMATIDSFKETKGHFWSFFGAYFLQSIVVVVLMLVCMGLFIGLGISLEGKGEIAAADVITHYTPYLLVSLVVFSIFAGAFSIARLCLGAYAYKIMHEGEELPPEPEPTPHVWPTLGE